MNTRNIAIIGYGAIARDLIGVLGSAREGVPDKITILTRAGREEAAQTVLADDNIAVTSDLENLLAASPDVVIECAGHAAVAAYGARVLSNGTDLIVASTGALAEADLAAELARSAKGSGAQCVVPSGAIGGIDALVAARISGLESVTLRSRKPPRAWAGTPAEDAVDLASLSEPFVFFDGSARQAAQTYPKNANVAATLALAGLGMDATRVQLIADPGTDENVHEYSVTSQALDYSIRLVGKPSPLNPKTSRSTVYSIARAVLNRRAAIAI